MTVSRVVALALRSHLAGALFCLVAVAGCSSGGVPRSAEPQFCPVREDTVGPAPWRLSDSELNASGRLVDSLLAWTRPEAYAGERWLGASLLRLRRAEPRLRGHVLARSILLAALESPTGPANHFLAVLLAEEIGADRIAIGDVVARRFSRAAEAERLVVATALGMLGSDSRAAAANELVACLELDIVAPLFVPTRAIAPMELAVSTAPFVVAVDNLVKMGPAGQLALERIRGYARADSGLSRYVGAVASVAATVHGQRTDRH